MGVGWGVKKKSNLPVLLEEEGSVQFIIFRLVLAQHKTRKGRGFIIFQFLLYPGENALVLFYVIRDR